MTSTKSHTTAQLRVDAPPGPQPPEGRERARIAERATWLSVLVNLVVSVAQLLFGWLAHSQSLTAHGLHSFSDLLSDFLVIYAGRKSAHPADDEHPYGHGRIETVATLSLGIALVVVGAAILADAVQRLRAPGDISMVGWSALWVALLTLISKEALFHFLLRVAQRLRSPMLMANAWHTRADAASALVVVVGVGGSLAGLPMLDTVAAILVGFMILRMGGRLAWDSLSELIDTGVDLPTLQRMKDCLNTSPGVVGLHEIRSRRTGHKVLIDAHIEVAPRISVSEGHHIAERARARFLASFPEALDVLVHVDSEDDLRGEPGGEHLAPDRQELVERLNRHFSGLATFSQPPLLHYLKNGVEAELFIDDQSLQSTEQVRSLVASAHELSAQDPVFRAIRLHRTL